MTISAPIMQWYVGHISKTNDRLLTGYNQMMIIFQKFEFHNLSMKPTVTQYNKEISVC